ncbi:hypothetical protein [Pseudomonas citronellolis]|uniref:hypothetical protein n=1 Tax=Pseudomonas citronellolis TaxID=53408 RepID=UPI000B17B7FF|nr:hypothetical protein [Pseudomonas humi]
MRSEKSKDTSGRALGVLCVVDTQPRAAIRRTAPDLPVATPERHPAATWPRATSPAVRCPALRCAP